MAENSAFTAGLTPGGLTTDFEVKMLLCYLLDEAGCGVQHSQLVEVFQQTGYVNYFEFSEAISELTAARHILASSMEDGNILYTITETGQQSVRAVQGDLPRSVREKCLAQLMRQLQDEQNSRDHQIEFHKVEDGYQISISICDIGSNLMDIRLFVPNLEQCEMIKQNFLEDPSGVYREILLLLTRQKI